MSQRCRRPVPPWRGRVVLGLLVAFGLSGCSSGGGGTGNGPFKGVQSIPGSESKGTPNKSGRR